MERLPAPAGRFLYISVPVDMRKISARKDAESIQKLMAVFAACRAARGTNQTLSETGKTPEC